MTDADGFFLSPLLEGTATAVQTARNRVGDVRPATVVGISPGRESATVVDDHNLNGAPYGAQVIAPGLLVVGDRVMVMFYPPHGAMIVGWLRGGYMPWQIMGTVTPDIPGSFGSGWVNDTGTGGPGTAAPGVLMYRRLASGMVEVRGKATRVSGSASRIAWLPVGFRPSNNLFFCVVTGPVGVPGTALVQSDGQIISGAGVWDQGSGGFAELDTVSFTTE